MLQQPIFLSLTTIPGFQNLLLDENAVDSKLNQTNCRRGPTSYKVIRYDKTMLNHDLVSVQGLCRSVIANAEGRVVCFSPPKSIAADIFLQKYADAPPGELVAEEFVEGTMVNVFFDPLLQQWEIATRNTVGAESTFYKTTPSKTFREMFFEAAEACNMKIEQDLISSYCYSFVLQHPENRIVVPFARPQLYLVAIYQIMHQEMLGGIDIIQYPLNSVGLARSFGTVKLPETYSFESYGELIEKYASANTPYNIVGVMLKNVRTGERTKIRNPVYEQVRALRGNQPKLQYQYLCLRKEGKVKDFLNFYPEKKEEFAAFRNQVHWFTHTLYANYVSCYIKKEKKLIDFGEEYRTHMFHLHQLYRHELKEKSQYINSQVVQSYVNELHPSLLMHCLNLPLRQNSVDVLIHEQ